MAITTYQAWINDGSPIKPAVCIADWIATFRRHGYEVGYYPDERHLKAQPPEDHTPYSHTPWPGIQPYPYVLASDLMPPTKPGLPSLSQIGARVVLDKQKGLPGTEFIKYINWTDLKGNCWHDEWEPTYRRSPSTDRGHIHISARTDWVLKHTAYDPVAILLGDDMEQRDRLTSPTSSATRTIGNHFADIQNMRDWLYSQVGQTGLVNPPPPGSVAMALLRPTSVVLTPEDRRLIVADLIAAVEPMIRDAVADLGEGGAAQVRADAP